MEHVIINILMQTYTYKKNALIHDDADLRRPFIWIIILPLAAAFLSGFVLNMNTCTPILIWICRGKPHQQGHCDNEPGPIPWVLALIIIFFY